jgi:ribonuclease-3 family protein
MIEGGLPFDIREVPASVLAYIGDAVFELYVRLHVAQTASGGSGDLHRRTVRFVSAAAQSQSMRFLLSRLTETEAAVFRRCRNHTAASMPKNVDPVSYRIASGFEGLIGYLYITGAKDRLDELMRLVWENKEKMDESI